MKEITDLGYTVATVSYDPVETLDRFAKRRKIGFTMLSDPKSEAIRAFNVFNNEHAPGAFGYGIAYPTIVVLDAAGVVRGVYAEAHFTQRPDPDAVIEALSTLDGSKS